MGQKICCGGFNLGEGLELDGRTLKATGGSGLPDPSALSDGTAMVAVNGEWKMQEGYGYYGEPAFEPITWDGSTEGRDAITINDVSLAYKVSDIVFTTDMLDGATSVTSTGYSGGVKVIDNITSFLYVSSLADSGFNFISGSAGEYSEMGGGVVIPSDGTYFSYSDGAYITSLTAPASVHQFNPALIGGGLAVNLELVYDEQEGITVTSADKTIAEIITAIQSGLNVIANLWFGGSIYMSVSFYNCMEGSVAFGYFWDGERERPSTYVIGTIGEAGDSWIVQGLG